jgi:lipocalin
METKRLIFLIFSIFIIELNNYSQISENQKSELMKKLKLSELIQLDENDYFLVKSIKDKKWGVYEITFDENNSFYHQPLLTCRYDTIDGWFNHDEPFIILRNNNKNGLFLNPFENRVKEASISFEFDSLLSIRKDGYYYAIAKKRNRWGYVDWKNNSLSDFNYNRKEDILNHLFSEKDGNEIKLVFQHPEFQKPNHIQFSENKRYVAVSEIDLAYRKIIYTLFSTTPPTLISSNKIELMENNPVIEAVSNDGKYFRIGNFSKNKFIAFYDVNAEKLIYGQPDKIDLQVNYMEASSSESGNYTIDWWAKDTIKIINRQTKSIRLLDNKFYKLKYAGGQRVQLSPDAKYLGIYENRNLKIWEIDRNEIVWTSPKQSFFIPNPEFALLANNIVAFTSVLENQRDAHLYWFDFINKKILFDSNHQIFSRIEFVIHRGKDILLASGDSGKQSTNIISRINLATGAISKTKSGPIGYKDFISHQKAFQDSLKSVNPEQYDYSEKNRQYDFSWFAMYDKYFNDNGSIKDSSKRCQLDVSFFEGIKTKWLSGKYEVINALDNKASYRNVSDQSYLFLKFPPWKELLFWNGNKQTDERKVTMLSTYNGSPFFYTHDGYYFGSKEIANFLRFSYQGKSYTFEQFDLKFNRPDIILERLGYADSSIIHFYRKAYEKRLQKYGFEQKNLKSDLHAPKINIVNAEDLLRTFTENELKIQIEATDSVFKLNRINIWINDVPVYGVNGIDISKLNTNSYRDQMSLKLSRGKNKIQISAHNNNATESFKETFYVDYQVNTIQKPDLYFVAIGISDYVNPMNNLNYADKDARDLIQMFEERSDIYNRIRIIPLLNYQATKANILALKDSLIKSKPDDHVILFYAGHGIIGDDGQYYLCNTDIKNDNIFSSATPYTDFETIIDSIPARNKLILIDACHSGEADNEEIKIADYVPEQGNKKSLKINYFGRNVFQSSSSFNSQTSFDLMKSLFSDLRRNTGATIIASAGAGEYAYEGGEISNGVFTYFLMEALKNKQADYNKDKMITVSELIDYISLKVQKHTSGKQNPGKRSENLAIDFQIW